MYSICLHFESMCIIVHFRHDSRRKEQVCREKRNLDFSQTHIACSFYFSISLSWRQKIVLMLLSFTVIILSSYGIKNHFRLLDFSPSLSQTVVVNHQPERDKCSSVVCVSASCLAEIGRDSHNYPVADRSISWVSVCVLGCFAVVGYITINCLLYWNTKNTALSDHIHISTEHRLSV